MIRFVPAVRIRDSIDDRAPLPSAIITMTAATPMMIPSAVSVVRSTLRRSASTAVSSVSQRDISSSVGSCVPGRPEGLRYRSRANGYRPLPPVGRRRPIDGTSGEELCAALADLAPSVRTPVAIVAPGWSASLTIATLVPSDTPSVTRTR